MSEDTTNKVLSNNPEPQASACASQSPHEPQASTCADSPESGALRSAGATVFPRKVVVGLAILAFVSAAIAWARVGMLDLPLAPRGMTLESAGLGGLDSMADLDRSIRGGAVGIRVDSGTGDKNASTAPKRAREGSAKIKAGDEPGGLSLMAGAVREEPGDLVVGNAYRIAVFGLQRAYLVDAHKRGLLTPSFPDYLRDEPIALFESIARENPSREVRLQLALSWVDKMLLFPALEIKAPSSVEAVDILTGILEDEPGYVPALFARGLNHLHRPARLVWPEADKTPIDAAAQDIGMCVAIGRKLGAGSDRLQARLAIALGDAYVKAGRLNVARSWWQIAQNLCHQEDVQRQVRTRYAWGDREILDRLEEELDKARSELNEPMTDLAMMWN